MISLGPSLLIFFLQHGHITNEQHNLAYVPWSAGGSWGGGRVQVSWRRPFLLGAAKDTMHMELFEAKGLDILLLEIVIHGPWAIGFACLDLGIPIWAVTGRWAPNLFEASSKPAKHARPPQHPSKHKRNHANKLQTIQKNHIFQTNTRRNGQTSNQKQHLFSNQTPTHRANDLEIGLQ